MPSLQAALPRAPREEGATEKLQLSLVVMEEVAAATEIRTIAEGTEEISLAQTTEGLGVVAKAKPRPSQLVVRLQAAVRGHLRWDYFHQAEVDLFWAKNYPKTILKKWNGKKLKITRKIFT